jgi:hypothetical protein
MSQPKDAEDSVDRGDGAYVRNDGVALTIYTDREVGRGSLRQRFGTGSIWSLVPCAGSSAVPIRRGRAGGGGAVVPGRRQTGESQLPHNEHSGKLRRTKTAFLSSPSFMDRVWKFGWSVLIVFWGLLSA